MALNWVSEPADKTMSLRLCGKATGRGRSYLWGNGIPNRGNHHREGPSSRSHQMYFLDGWGLQHPLPSCSGRPVGCKNDSQVLSFSLWPVYHGHTGLFLVGRERTVGYSRCLGKAISQEPEMICYQEEMRRILTRLLNLRCASLQAGCCLYTRGPCFCVQFHPP